ncbi:uncharacterized protein LOC107653302 [Sinocyclocheilus anshuiensis]|uniref:uncharacterized protein LOC107653302 n=1 Tax=Sinocyclocheilus anshuiensis TaxID=1608454 RepID=UPI0007B99DBC|nr:PREDICTED: uncharacterized protein LOC107653302 [Sinocyclocheilus anshuiensis]
MRAVAAPERALAIQQLAASFRVGASRPLKVFQRMLGLMASVSPVLQLGLLRMRPLQYWLKPRVPSRTWHLGRLRVKVDQACVFQRMLGLMASVSPVLQLGLFRMRPLQYWLKPQVPSCAWRLGRLRVKAENHAGSEHHEVFPCRRDENNKPVCFLFNNRQKEERDEEYQHRNRLDWEMGERSINRFLALLEEKNRKSVQMTLDVLKERRQLEACVSNLMERITEKELKTQELTQIQEALGQNREKIEKCENFKFTVQQVFKEKVPIKPVIVWSWSFLKKWNDLATCCSVCKETCHDEYGCWLIPFDNVKRCQVMKEDHCTVCTNKCHYSKHNKEDKKYVTTTKTVTMTFDELQQKYPKSGEKPRITNYTTYKYEDTKQEHESIMKEFQRKTEIETKLDSDLEKIKNEKSKLLHEAYTIIMNLCKIALKADSAFTLRHLDFLIPRLKEEGKDEWIKDLEDLKKTGEQQKNKGAVHHLMAFFGNLTGKK